MNVLYQQFNFEPTYTQSKGSFQRAHFCITRNHSCQIAHQRDEEIAHLQGTRSDVATKAYGAWQGHQEDDGQNKQRKEKSGQGISTENDRLGKETQQVAG